MNYLTNKRCYLSGPIEHASTDWRIYPTKVLTEEFGVDLYNPFGDPKHQWKDRLIEARNNKDLKTIRNIAKKFVRKDLAMIDRSDFLVCFLPLNVATYGTCHELINSVNAKKPSLIVGTDHIVNIPFWFHGFIDQALMFASWDELFVYLKEVDEGKHKDNDKWSFVYGLV